LNFSCSSVRSESVVAFRCLAYQQQTSKKSLSDVSIMHASFILITKKQKKIILVETYPKRMTHFVASM
jgi:hypothetical protein